MIILPAIDLKDGRCVRLYKGDFDTVHDVAEDALEVARGFVSKSAGFIHMVDLDGAKNSRRINGHIVRTVCENTPLKVELGGGIRSMADLEEVFGYGVYRAVIGSAAVTNPEFVKQAADKYGERIAVGIDAKDGLVKTSGWVEDSGLDYLEFAKKMEALGVKIIIFTDIETDGTMEGPALSKLKALSEAVDCKIIASGGVSSNGDIIKLKAAGMYGAIIGKAYYAGKLDLAQAIKEGE